MEEIQLKDFIEGTLVNIAQGIRNANKKLIEEEQASKKVYNLRSNIGDSSKKYPGFNLMLL